MEKNQQDDHFSVLENKNIGRNFVVFRKLRDKKAMEVAGELGISEAAYTKYERGESKITIDIVQKVAEILEVDPFTLMSSLPFGSINNGNNSPIQQGYGNHYEGIDREILQTLMKVLEDSVAINKRLMEYLDETSHGKKSL